MPNEARHRLGPGRIVAQGQAQRPGRVAERQTSDDAVFGELDVYAHPEHRRVPVAAAVQVGDGQFDVVNAGQVGHCTDPQRIIQLWLANGRQILHRVAPLMRVMRGATGTDPELAAQWETNQRQTRTAYALLVQLLADRGALKPGMDIDQAGDIAFTIANVETYLQFTDVCGWTPDQWQARTAAILTDTLLTPT